MPACSFVSNLPRLFVLPPILIIALYLSPLLDTPIKPVFWLGVPRFFWVPVDEEEEEEEEEDEEEDEEFIKEAAAWHGVGRSCQSLGQCDHEDRLLGEFLVFHVGVDGRGSLFAHCIIHLIVDLWFDCGESPFLS